MPFIDYETCEPLRVWGRLEPRSRDVDFDGAIAARVHDPLWMLNRQWQMGEFQGEDTGSAVLAKIARRVTPVTRHAIGPNGAVEAEDDTLPADARVERLAIRFAPITCAQIGRTFLLHLQAAADDASPAPAVPFDVAEYRRRLRSAYGIDPPTEPTDPVGRARARATARARRTTAALAGRGIDGVGLRHDLALAGTALPAALAAGVASEHVPIVAEAARRFAAWFDELYPAPGAQGDAWDAAQLEYQAACMLPSAAGDVELTLAEHVTGRLDWWSYDQGALSPGTSAATSDVRSVIPTPARFAGMPNPRWWQFEDAAVDLGNFRAQATDLARIVVAEFALVYGNNWFAIPCNQDVGTLAEIEGIVVTDVFGQRTLVRAAVGASSGSWGSWDLFSLSPRGTTAAAPVLGQHLFLPATAVQTLDAEPHETVTLVRDEMADMVWGIERRVADGLGGGQDGIEAARRFTESLLRVLQEERPEVIPAVPPPPPDPSAPKLRYRLGTEVSESWIPFLPVHRDDGLRAIQLQRASMPRFLDSDADPQLVRPRTTILRHGLSEQDALLEQYHLNEEEVPRTGVTVNGALRRARWLDGRTVVWHGRTVVTGRGEVDSGLRFDVVEPVELG
jgi:hypothetical protein